MIITHVGLKNWRNFRSVDVALSERVFLAGPNASGKSNFLDAFRFLRDIAKPGGGLQKAVSDRGGLSKIRCLAAREYPDVEMEVHLSEASNQVPTWKYAIGIKQDPRGYRQPYLAHERVWQRNEQLLDRPDSFDKEDKPRRTQTHLEQIGANRQFREIAKFFESVLYLHLVPQLVRHPEIYSGPGNSEDPFGRSFLDRVVRTPQKVRRSRLKKIEGALILAVPQIKGLIDVKDDESGIPHLEAVYEHWRPKGAKQREDQFSDGTLRLIGLLWSMLDGESPLLLEEPELSLNSGIVRRLPSLMYRVQRQRKRQIILSTHSADLLSDKGIGGEEVLLLTPSVEGTRVEPANSIKEVRHLLEGGLSIAEAALPRTVPHDVQQLDLFE
ncbi:MAG: AAA family ATPase [Acidobacteriia bacterium]|nr:AAA family ATPase [Terriglobia bacterium]